ALSIDIEQEIKTVAIDDTCKQLVIDSTQVFDLT
ncbi:unnamed protein product, partial [Rotaria sp. Silwood2]